jgi:hypothetical protein
LRFPQALHISALPYPSLLGAACVCEGAPIASEFYRLTTSLKIDSAEYFLIGEK